MLGEKESMMVQKSTSLKESLETDAYDLEQPDAITFYTKINKATLLINGCRKQHDIKITKFDVSLLQAHRADFPKFFYINTTDVLKYFLLVSKCIPLNPK